MEKEAKRKKLDCPEPPDPEMAKSLNAKSGSICVDGSSCSSSSEIASTSPILDTLKSRRKGKLLMPRRAISDSAHSPSFEKFDKHKKNQDICDVSSAKKNSETFAISKNLTRCPSCDFSMDDNLSCKNCSSVNLADRSSDCLNVSLADRFGDLKRSKKPRVKLSESKKEQIDEDIFVRSVRMLENASLSNLPTKVLQKPVNQLGLVPFVELEHLSRFEEKTQRNSIPVTHRPGQNTALVTHLSLDEDKEEDIFADAKECAEIVEGIEDFTQWRYETADTSATSFHGFSSQEYNRSRDIAARGSQVRDLEDLDDVKNGSFHGFSPADSDTSESLLEKRKFLLKHYFSDSQVWDDWFEPRLDVDEHENLKDTRENFGLSANNENPAAIDETISKAETICPMSSSSTKKLGNIGFLGDCEKRLRSSGIITKAKSPSVPEMRNIEDNSTGNSKSRETLRSKSDFGFSTAAGRSIAVSEVAVGKAKLLYSEVIKSTNDETLDDGNFDAAFDSRSKCGFSTAGGRAIRVSKTALEKAEARLSKDNEMIEPELFEDELDNVRDSETTVFNAKTLSSKDTEIVDDSRAGIIQGSKIALDKTETRLSEDNEIMEPELFEDELDNVRDSETAISKAKTISSKDAEAADYSRAKCKVSVSPEAGCSSKLTDLNLPCGFSTARGLPCKISEKAVSRAQQLYSSLDDLGTEEIVENSPKKTKKTEESTNESRINLGFATAGGRELKVSEASWLKRKAVFDAIEEQSFVELTKTRTEPFSLDAKSVEAKNKAESMPSGISRSGGHSINIGTDAASAVKVQSTSDLDNLESLDLEDFEEPVEEPEVAGKRKFTEVDEETPLRRDSSQKRKRGRYVNDLQARKLFDEGSARDEEDDEAGGTKKRSELVGSKNLISEEVDASAAALLEDEELSNEGTAWQKDALQRNVSLSPELGCEAGNRSRAGVSTRNLLGTTNRADLEKVNVDGGRGGDSRFSGSSAETEESNDRAGVAERREEPQEIQHESIPDDLTFDTQFSQDIQRSPEIDKFIAETMKVIEGRLAAISKQDEAIRAKRRTKPESNDGFLYRLRTSNRDSRTSWMQLTEGIAPAAREISGDSLGRDLRSITADSAVQYSFRCAHFYGENNVRRNIEGIKVGDGAFLILDEKNCAGIREFERAFLASPGVDPNLVPTGWVRNHYRWIVWKLASMDRVKFGHKCLPRMLTPDRVMLELKYRYDREIYRTQWPPIRRILERSEDASARLVLCVSSIIPEDNVNTPVKGAHTPNSIGLPAYKMRVTDGWYSIVTSIDAAMINLIKSGKVREGTKLMIFGAKAMNLDQGCSALEIPEAVTLRIHSNSTRRAKWNTKLDYYRDNCGPMCLRLKSVKPNGGAICKLVVAVSRVYPILYREKLPDGQFVFRNARCDEEAARAHEARYQSKMEEIYANAWSEFQIDSMKRKSVASTMRRNYTQEEAEACSRDVEEELRERISSKMSECLPTPRDVTPVMKLRIAEDDTCALVTVWSTDRDTTELFVEGSSIAIYNAFASGLRSNELQITAGRSTFVKRQVSRRISYPERVYSSLTDVTEAGFNPVYGEFDTIGIVSSIGPAPHGMKNFETVNLASPRTGDASESNFLSVLFWQGVSAHGYAKILTVGSLVACSNLGWRRNTSRGIPTAYCTDRSVFSKNPRQNHLTQAFESLRNEIKEPVAYAAACATIIEEEIAKKSALRTPGGGTTPYKPATSNSRTPGWSPRDLTSSIDANCTTPRIDSKKAATRKRLEKLETYGEPPKLPSIVMNNSSRKVLSDFRSPVVNPPVTKS